MPLAKTERKVRAWTWERDSRGKEAIGPWRPHAPPRPAGAPGSLEFQSEELLFQVRVATRVSLGIGPDHLARGLMLSLGELVSAQAGAKIARSELVGVLARATRSLAAWESWRHEQKTRRRTG
jgi:hypothetical protein